VIVGSTLDAAEMERHALELLTDDALRTGLLGRLERSGIIDGTVTALDAIERLHGR
jgi:hypothetical protein